MHPAVMLIKEESSGGPEYAQVLLAAGGLLGALAASSCCILPLVLFGLGVSGAWIGNFTRLAPYQPYFLAIAFLCLGAGGWLVHRTSTKACAEGEACARPLSGRLIKASLFTAALLILAAIGFDVLGPLLLF
jgi:mercuric ion transport protein